MCVPPVIQICATPSQPVFPYRALQTSTRPAVGRHDLGFVLPATTCVLSTVDCVQSLHAVTSLPSQSPLTLSPSLIVNGFDVRAQWNPPHEWFAEADPARANGASRASDTTKMSFFTGFPLLRMLLDVGPEAQRRIAPDSHYFFSGFWPTLTSMSCVKSDRRVSRAAQENSAGRFIDRTVSRRRYSATAGSEREDQPCR